MCVYVLGVCGQEIPFYGQDPGEVRRSGAGAIKLTAGASFPLSTLSPRHVLISLTFPYGIVILALVDSAYEMPNKTLKVRYWPRDTWPMGLPYVEMGDDHKSC